MDELDPIRIRDFALITENDTQMVQFIALGDKHKMFRDPNGDMAIETLHEQGRPYNYKKPFSIDHAINILSQSNHDSHSDILKRLQEKVDV